MLFIKLRIEVVRETSLNFLVFKESYACGNKTIALTMDPAHPMISGFINKELQNFIILSICPLQRLKPFTILGLN